MMVNWGNRLLRQQRAVGVALLAIALSLGLASRAHAYVYWSQQAFGANGEGVGEPIYRANLDGGGARLMNGDQSSAGDLAVAGHYLYFGLNGDGGGIGRMGIDGSHLLESGDGAIKPFITPATAGEGAGMGGVVTDGSHLYWSWLDANGDAKLGRSNLDGSQIDQNLLTLPSGSSASGTPPELAIADGNIYWASPPGGGGYAGGTIGEVNLASGTTTYPLVMLPDGATPVSVAVGGGSIYWINDDGSGDNPTIGRANLDGTGVNPDLITTTGSGSAGGSLVVFGDHLYWGMSIPRGTTADGAIARANLDGSGQTWITLTSGPVGGIAFDSYDGSQVPLAANRTSVAKPRACHVPRLFGEGLEQANLRLVQAGCNLGRIRFGRSSRGLRGRVIRQSIRPGRTVRAGSHIGVTVGR